jgi:hypothetical protein
MVMLRASKLVLSMLLMWFAWAMDIATVELLAEEKLMCY